MQQQKLKIEKTTMHNLDNDFHNYFPSLNFELKDFQKKAVERGLSKKSATRNPKQGSVKKNDTSLFF